MQSTTHSHESPSPMMNPDVLVVGGGPIGLATAIAVRLEGLSATVVERRLPPLDKACGEGIMPDGVALLQKLGVNLPADGSFRFRGICYQEGNISTRAHFQGLTGIGMRRTTLQAALMQRAEELGVHFMWGRQMRELLPTGARLSDGMIRARWTVAADGLNSGIRRTLGLDGRIRRQRVGLRRHYGIAPWSDLVEVSFTDGCQAYVTPVAADQICVVALTDDPRQGFDRLLARFPDLDRRLQGIPLASEEQGGASVFRRARGVVRGRVALVGDAAVSVDAITGEGVSLGLHQAVALARSLGRGGLDEYARSHPNTVRVTIRMTRLLLAIDRRPRLRRLALRILQRRPRLFSNLLGVHTRELSLAQFGARLFHLDRFGRTHA
jgi:2-polyprenyl-6-methoxyphenol hydroxylase-like FAD-dependent oxidoreductase